MELKPIFFWNNEVSEYPEFPMPELDSKFWKEVEEKTYYKKEFFASHLLRGAVFCGYRGFSSCRICNEILGTRDLTDLVYVFPEKCEHYILEHDIKVPWEWIYHVINYQDFLRNIIKKL